jgi:hypothetical protein
MFSAAARTYMGNSRINDHNHWQQNSPFSAIAFLRRFCQICLELYHPVFTYLDFATIFIFFHRARSSALCQTPKLEDQVCPSSDRVAQLYAQAPDILSIAFYDSQGHGGGILTHLHMGYYNDNEY